MDARSPECPILAEKRPSRKRNGRCCAGLVSILHKIFTDHNTLNIQSVSRLECAGSCPNLMMSRRDVADVAPAPSGAVTPQLPHRAHHHRPLCMSVSSDSSGRFKALDTQEWKNNLKAQVAANRMEALL